MKQAIASLVLRLTLITCFFSNGCRVEGAKKDDIQLKKSFECNSSNYHYFITSSTLITIRQKVGESLGTRLAVAFVEAETVEKRLL